MPQATLLASLPVERRLALSYAPQTSHGLWLGLFALDARLCSIVRAAREPALAQIKLAWWRDELARSGAQRRRGEPLLELLDDWGDHASGLGALADGWELLLGDAPLGDEEVQAATLARATACLALAERLDLPHEGIAAAARGWALADLAPALAQPAATKWPRLRLPREMRPLQVLYGLAAWRRGQLPLIPGPLAALRAVRLGLLGI